MAEQRERFRVAWVDTDAGGRIHFTAAFRWAEATETSLYRRLGLLQDGRGDLPRRHVEAEFRRALVFEDEIEVQHPRRAGGDDVDHVRVGDLEGWRDRGRRGAHRRARGA